VVSDRARHEWKARGPVAGRPVDVWAGGDAYEGMRVLRLFWDAAVRRDSAR
jgi:hypothetical protein